MKSKVYYCKPSITDLEIESVLAAMKNGWGDKAYECINLFENSFKNFIGTQHAIATSSCTGALHMGLYALGISKGDEVILADTNWIATVAPISHLGAKPIFVDILPDTWCIDPRAVEKKITKKTKAIIATHLYGNLCDMQSLLKISQKYNIPIIEDSAEAIGSIYHGKRAGSMGLFSAFSFHGSKTITTGEGGIFLTDDSELYEKVLTISNHGRSRLQKKQFWPDQIGFKYKMSNVQAAIGLAQMKRIESLIEKKRDILKYYKQRINLKMNPEYKKEVNGAWMPTVVFEPSQMAVEDILSIFKKENIDARTFFLPLSSLDMFEENKQNIHAYDISSRAINLPSYYDITHEEQDRVIEVCQHIQENSTACSFH